MHCFKEKKLKKKKKNVAKRTVSVVWLYNILILAFSRCDLGFFLRSLIRARPRVIPFFFPLFGPLLPLRPELISLSISFFEDGRIARCNVKKNGRCLCIIIYLILLCMMAQRICAVVRSTWWKWTIDDIWLIVVILLSYYDIKNVT